MKKQQNDPSKPKKQANWRIVVRAECETLVRRNGSKPGGYPLRKNAPVIKCTRKGPAGSNKLKPNGRRYGSSKLLEYQNGICTPP